jgi:hypothetical protein
MCYPGSTGSADKGVAAEHGDFYRTADLLDSADQALLRRVQALMLRSRRRFVLPACVKTVGWARELLGGNGILLD